MIEFPDINGKTQRLSLQSPVNVAFNADNMTFLKSCPDKCFDLCIADPPYRDSADNQPTKDMRKNGTMRSFGDRPSKELFSELFRVSKEQIIFGANNFELPPYKGFIVWKKKTISEDFTMSMAEIAYISEGLGTISKVYECAPQGTGNDPRIHPTQKPVALYSWIYQKFPICGGGGNLGPLFRKRLLANCRLRSRPELRRA